ncbi:hypothetical protein ES705_18507 [subsurface metagenome]
MSYCYSYPHPALTVDAILLTYTVNELDVLFVQRAVEPYKNQWAFPGGFVNENETVEDAVIREIKEETSLSVKGLQQFYTASAPGRDPRGWTVSVVFIGFINWDSAVAKAGDDAANAEWFPLLQTPSLAFDHGEILSKAKLFLKKLVMQSVINKELLPTVFPLEQLNAVYFQITGSREESELLIQQLIDKSIIIPETYKDLYTFNDYAYNKVLNSGFFSV